MEEMARLTGHLTPRGLAGELAKLRHKEAEVYVSHLKLRHDEEIEQELRDLPDGRRIHLLRDGQRIHL